MWIVDQTPLKISPRKTEGEAGIVVVTFIRESSTPMRAVKTLSFQTGKQMG